MEMFNLIPPTGVSHRDSYSHKWKFLEILFVLKTSDIRKKLVCGIPIGDDVTWTFVSALVNW